LTGGGTAGHVYPALALASELRGAGHEVEFAGAPGSLELGLATDEGYPFTAFSAAGFDRARPLTLITSTFQIAFSTIRAWRWLGSTQIAAVAGFGGYVSIPLGLAARLRGVPLVIHEQNSVPGLANKLLARWARRICVTYPASSRYFGHAAQDRVIHTGNPVRAELLSASRASGRAALDLPEDAVVVLVFGGSRGARHLNEVVVSLGQEMLADDSVYVVHATGPAEFESVSAAVAARGVDAGRYRVLPYIERMGDAMAAADIAICRAGATTIAELTALGLGAVLVPYPYATDDHQTKNAAAMVEHGAAIMVPDAEIDAPGFRSEVLALVASSERRASMALASRGLGRVDAARSLAQEVLYAAKPDSFGG